MEKVNVASSFNSPVIQKFTPIKRLGLSRKRKSSGPDCKLDPKIRASSENLSAGYSEKSLSKKETFTAANDSGTTDSERNYDERIDLLNKSIAEKEEKLKAFQNSNIVQLEELIETWKIGCKNAFLYFSELIRERHREGVDVKLILKNLGIWEVMTEHFGSDPDLALMEDSQ